MITKQQYIQILRERSAMLKDEILIDQSSGVFVETNDPRYRERNLINLILRIHRDDSE